MKDRPVLRIQSLQNDARLIMVPRTVSSKLSSRKSRSVFFCAHFGTSMNPTLCELDVLEIAPYGNRPIRVGDVIFFVLPDWTRPAVHRVVRITPECISTRGDNNNLIDSWVIVPEDVIGQVLRAARGKVKRPIFGGIAGQLWAVGVSIFKVVVKVPSFFYHLLACSRLLRYLLPLHKRMRIITINQPGGEELQLVLGHWLVGRHKLGTERWWIRRPFRLFVDERSLPR